MRRARIVISAACLVVAGCGSSNPRAPDSATPDAGFDGGGDRDGPPDGVDAGTIADAPNVPDAPTAADAADATGALDAVDAGNGVDATGGGSDARVIPDVCATAIAYQSPSPIVAVLPGRAGLVVVHADEVVLAARSGSVRRRLSWPRQILAAVWAADRAVILDRGVLTTLDDQLDTLGRVNLIESCVQVAVADAGRIVCGPANDWDRIFYTYDVATPALVARSQAITYEGIPMRTVPGRPWFMTQEALFSLNAAGEAQMRLSFSFGGTGVPMPPFAFAGNPATHVVDRVGQVFRLQDDCLPSCFVSAGVWASGFAGGMIDGPAGSVLQPGIAGAKRIDVLTGAVLSAGGVTTNQFASVSSAVYDPFCGVVTTVADRFSDGLVRSVEQVPYEGSDGGVGP